MKNLKRRQTWEHEHRKNNFIKILWILGASLIILMIIVIIFISIKSDDEKKSTNENNDTETNTNIASPSNPTNNTTQTAGNPPLQDNKATDNKIYATQKNTDNTDNQTTDQDQTNTKEEDKKAKLNSTVKAMSTTALELVNNYRAKFNLKSLTYNSSLEQIATKKACDVKNCVEVLKLGLAHDCPPSGRISDMLKRNGISYITNGENLAVGKYKPSTIVIAWIKSKPHLANIIYANFQFTAVGICISKQNIYWVQLFLQK